MSQTTNGHRVSYNATTPAYFDVLGLRLVRGQVYGMASNEPVAMVSEGVARTFWGRTDPLGQTLERVWGARNPFDPSTPPHTIRIIGVVSDAVTDLRSTNGLAVYRPLTPSSAMAARLIIRTREDWQIFPAPLDRRVRATHRRDRTRQHGVACERRYRQGARDSAPRHVDLGDRRVRGTSDWHWQVSSARPSFRHVSESTKSACASRSAPATA